MQPDNRQVIAELLEDHTLVLAALETPAFWSDLLGGGHAGASIEDVLVEPVGTGQVASCLRVHLAHESDDLPKSVVVKTGRPTR